MKIKRRKKNDRTAFWFMRSADYLRYRLTINHERRLDKTLPPPTKQTRDRARAAKFRQLYYHGPGVRLSDLVACPKCGTFPMAPVHHNAVINARIVLGCNKCGYNPNYLDPNCDADPEHPGWITTTAQPGEPCDPLYDADPGTLGP